jgi:hypothetical protein
MQLKIGNQMIIKTLDANRKRMLPQSYIWISDNFTINGYLQRKNEAFICIQVNMPKNSESLSFSMFFFGKIEDNA